MRTELRLPSHATHIIMAPSRVQTLDGEPREALCLNVYMLRNPHENILATRRKQRTKGQLVLSDLFGSFAELDLGQISCIQTRQAFPASCCVCVFFFNKLSHLFQVVKILFMTK